MKDPEDDLGELVTHIDVSRDGIMEFSKGGSAASQFCVSDSRCVAGVNLSGFMFGDAKSDAFMVRIKEARHGNFSDWSLVGGYLKIVGMIGPINGQRCLEIQSQYVCVFFDRYLKGIDDVLLNGAGSSYPEVVFESRIYQGS